MKLNLVQTIASSLLTVAALYSSNASAFLFHAPGAECELYESGNGFTINGLLVSAKAPGVGTVNLSCPVLESETFRKQSAGGVWIDGNLSTQAGSSLSAQACSNPFSGGAAHCGTQRTISGSGVAQLFLDPSDIGAAWGSAIDNLDYPYVAISLVGTGTWITGYEVD